MKSILMLIWFLCLILDAIVFGLLIRRAKTAIDMQRATSLFLVSYFVLVAAQISIELFVK